MIDRLGLARTRRVRGLETVEERAATGAQERAPEALGTGGRHLEQTRGETDDVGQEGVADVRRCALLECERRLERDEAAELAIGERREDVGAGVAGRAACSARVGLRPPLTAAMKQPRAATASLAAAAIIPAALRATSAASSSTSICMSGLSDFVNHLIREQSKYC